VDKYRPCIFNNFSCFAESLDVNQRVPEQLQEILDDLEKTSQALEALEDELKILKAKTP
jgi:hypothetical protein